MEILGQFSAEIDTLLFELERLAGMYRIWRLMLPYLQGPPDDVDGPITPADVDRWRPRQLRLRMRN